MVKKSGKYCERGETLMTGVTLTTEAVARLTPHALLYQLVILYDGGTVGSERV